MYVSSIMFLAACRVYFDLILHPRGSQKMSASKTLFVRNLPYSTSDTQLEELFSGHGQLKACFTVKEKGLCTRTLI